MDIAPIRVQGLREFARALRQIGPEAAKGLRVANNRAATAVIDVARRRVPTRSGAARRSIVARSTRTEVRVAAGGRRAPYYPWLDFGGRVGRDRSIARPFIAQGRYLWSAYADLRVGGRLEQIMVDALADVAADAGLEVE